MEFIGNAISETFKYIADPTLISPGFAAFWVTIRAIFISVSVFLLAITVLSLKKGGYLDYRFADTRSEVYKKRPKYRIDIKERWKEAKEHTESSMDSERVLGIIEADDILKEVLDYFGYKGDTLLDKLILLSESIIPNIEGVKNSHQRVREAAHNPNIDISREEAKGIISVYEAVLEDMEMI